MTEFAPSRHHYEKQGLYGDYVRAAAGLLLTLGPVFATGATGTAAVILYGLAALFALFAIRTWLRQRTQVVVDSAGISTSGMRHVTVRWNALQRVKLSYFSTRRDRQRGWMQLILRDDSATVRVDSQLTDFDEVIARTAEALVAGGLRVNETTAANFAAYGHDVPVSGLLGEDEAGQRD